MKKIYFCKLTDLSNEINYMMQSKGTTQESIKYAIDNEFNNDLKRLYKYIFKGNTQKFDLTIGNLIIDDEEEEIEADKSATYIIIEEDNKINLNKKIIYTIQ